MNTDSPEIIFGGNDPLQMAPPRTEAAVSSWQRQMGVGRLAWNRIWKTPVTPVRAWAQRYVTQYQGPVLIFNLSAIKDRMQRLSNLGDRFNTGFLMAVKGMPEEAVFGLAAKHLAGFDVSNAAELESLGEHAHGKMVFVTGGLTTSMPQLMKESPAWIGVLDSPEQMRQRAKMGQHSCYAIRLNSARLLVSEDPAYYPVSRFGFSEADIRPAIKQYDQPEPRGFHVHHGSERNAITTYLTMARNAVEMAARLNIGIEFLNLGGGLHCMGFESVEKLLARLREVVPSSVRIYFEPGRFLTQRAGYALARVGGRFKCDETPSYVVDLSARCHLKWSEPFLVLPMADKAKHFNSVRLFGPTCYEGDFVGEFQIPDHFSVDELIDTGSFLLFANVSGYSCGWNSGFNGVPRARIVFVEDAHA